MRDSDFTKLLRSARDAAARHQQLNLRLTEAFEDRYGTTYSDVDCEELIDQLDYSGGGRISANIADGLMSECGVEKIEDETQNE